MKQSIPFLLLQRISWVKDALGIKVRGVCGFWSVVRPKVQAIAIKSKPSHVSFANSIHSQQPSLTVLVCRPLVLSIDATRSVAQVFKSVIASISVNVVNMAARPFASRPQPNKAMRFVSCAADFDKQIAIVKIARWHTLTIWAHLVGGYAHPLVGRWVVMQEFAQTLYGKIVISHAVVPFKQWFGQKPCCVDSTSGLRHFTVMESQ